MRRLLKLGVKYANDGFDENNVLVTNFAYVTGVLATILFALILLVTHSYRQMLTLPVNLLLCLFALYFNSIGKFYLAMISACLLTSVIMPIHIYFFVGTGIQYYLLVATILVSFLSIGNTKVRYSLLSLMIISTIVTIGFVAFVHGAENSNTSGWVYFINGSMATISAGAVVLYIGNTIRAQKEKYNKLNNVKNRLLAIVTHDIRGPLNNIVSIYDLTEKGDLPENVAQDLLETAKKEVKGTTHFVDDVLMWVKNQMHGIKPKKVEVDLERLLTKVVQENRFRTELKSVEIKLAVNELKVQADADMLALAVRNLLVNAIKFSPSSGGIIELFAFHTDGETQISITDNGKGLSPVDIAKFNIQESFTNEGSLNEKGFGLGLLLVQDFLKMNNAYLKVSNAEGKGARFSIVLPD